MARRAVVRHNRHAKAAVMRIRRGVAADRSDQAGTGAGGSQLGRETLRDTGYMSKNRKFRTDKFET